MLFRSPADSLIGTWHLKIYITENGVSNFFGNVTTNDSVLYYSIIIDSATTTGIHTVADNHFDVSQNNPNPLFTGNTEIDYTTPVSGKMSFNVYNMLGQNVITRSLNAKQGINQIYINSKELSAGVYMYSINNGTQTITKRMVIGSR